MSFQDFVSTDVALEKYDLIRRDEKMIDYEQIQPISPSDVLMDSLEFDLKHHPQSLSEYALCERIIYPILREAWKRHSKLEVWSHIPIQVDEQLSGVPDYLIARKSPRGFQRLEMPLLVVVEAKREDFITGWGQCLAAMVAAQKLNSGIEPLPVIYGMVTTGRIWEIGKLENQVVTIHPFNLSLTQLNLLLGVLDYLFDECEAQLGKIEIGEKDETNGLALTVTAR